MSATPIILPSPQREKSERADLPEPNESVPSEIIRAIEPFDGLSDAIINSLAEGADLRHYVAGQTVFAMGQFDGTEYFVVGSGKMRVSVIDPVTGSVMVEDIGAGSPFALNLAFSSGEAAVFSQLAVTAEDDLTLVSLDAETLRNTASQRPSLMRNLAMFFAAELSVHRFTSIAADPAPEQRVYSALLKFVERDNISGTWRVPRMPKHRELAEHADVEENIAAAAVATLIQDGAARREYPGLIVNDMSRLNELAGQS